MDGLIEGEEIILHDAVTDVLDSDLHSELLTNINMKVVSYNN